MIAVLNNSVERTRFLKFMAVGTFGAIIDFGIANLLSHFFEMQLVYAGTIPLHAQCSATLFGTDTGPIQNPAHALLRIKWACSLLLILRVLRYVSRSFIFVEPPLVNFFRSSSLISSLTRNSLLGISPSRWQLNCYVVEFFRQSVFGLIMILTNVEAFYGAYTYLYIQRRSRGLFGISLFVQSQW